MGFTCFLCKEPFDKGNKPAKNGAGDEEQGRGVSATKCGHLFHTDCLKRVFVAQSENVWAPKICPVCRTSMGLSDVIRVQGCSYDAQRPALEEILQAKRRLQGENAQLLNNLEATVTQYKNLQIDAQRIKEEKEECELRLEQLIRLNVMRSSELNRCKEDNEKLKNMVISLTANLTGNTQHQDYNGLSSSHARMTYAGDMQGYQLQRPDISMMLNNQCNTPKPGHPPGLLFPMVGRGAENSLEQHRSAPGSRHNSEGSQASVSHNNNNLSFLNRAQDAMDNGMTGQSVAGKSHYLLQQNLNTFSQLDSRDYAKKTATMAWDNIDNILPPSKCTGGGVPMKERGLQTGGNGSPNSSTSNSTGDTPSIQLPIKSAPFPAMKKIENHEESTPLNMDDDLSADDSNEWLQKKSRRRISSKGRSSNRSSSKTDFSTDKKLYGQYHCTTCNAKWGSSQTVPNKPQTCRYCKTEVYPHTQGPILSRKQLELNSGQTETAATTKK